MQAVVGLLKHDQNIQSAIYELKKVGLAEDTIKVLADFNAIQDLFAKPERYQISGYMANGAIIGGTAFLLYDLILGGYACTNLLGYIPNSFLMCTAVGAVAVGAILGAIAGWFIAVDRFEKIAYQYTQGVSHGYKLMMVKVTDELTSKVARILRQEEAEVVKTFDDLQAEQLENT